MALRPAIVAGDTTAVITFISAFVGVLPTVLNILGSLAGLIWFCIQIYESDLVQRRILKIPLKDELHTD